MAQTPKTVYTYPLDGANRTFIINFEYLTRKFVQVTLIGKDRKTLVLGTDYRFVARTAIQTTVAWGSTPEYDMIEIRRVTSATDRLVDFVDGSILRTYDLNISNIQALHIAEEARDLSADTIAVNNDGNLDARTRRIVNVADPINDGDVVTLRFEKSWAASTLNNKLAAEAAARTASEGSSNATTKAAEAAESARKAAESERIATTAIGAIGTSVEDARTAADRSEAARDTTVGYEASAKNSKDAARTSELNAEVSRIAAEVAMGGAMASGRIYDTTAKGQAHTSNGQYYMILGKTPSDALALYKNVGSAQDTGKRVPNGVMIQLLEEAVMRATHGRFLANKNLLQVFESKGTNIGGSVTQAVVRWRAAAHNNGNPVHLTEGVFGAVNLTVTGAEYPSTPTDASVFSLHLRLQGFSGGTLVLNENLKRLAGTDVWYFRSTTKVQANITELKISTAPVPNVVIELNNGVLHTDGGYGFPEIDARNSAIAKSRLGIHEDVLQAFYREDSEANILKITERTDTTTVQLQQVISEQLVTYSAAVILECDGPYPEDGANYIKAEVFRNGAVLSTSSRLTRIGKSKIWYCANVPAGQGPHTLVKIGSDVPPGSTYVTLRNAVCVRGGFSVPFRLLLDKLKEEVTEEAVSQSKAAAKVIVDEALSKLDSSWPTTALDALATAKDRRVDFVMIGDSNQLMDGKGFDFGMRRALAARFGMYATQILMAHSFGEANSGGTPTQEAHGLCPMALYYRYVAPDVTIAPGPQNGITIDKDGHYPMNTDALLRCHFAYSTFATGSGEFTVGVRREAAPYNMYKMAPKVLTNAGAEKYVNGVFDLPKEDRGQPALGFKWVVPAQTALKGPFLSYFMRVEDVEKTNGISAHTLYGAGGQSLWDMSVQLDAYTTQQMTNFFKEVRRLQIEKGQKPIVVLYVNSGLNDLNETSTPSRGWRATTESKSPTAYIDNLEAVVKRVTDIWQANGWDERGLFVLSVPSHPTATPDNPNLQLFRKAAFSFGSGRTRTSMVDFENLTSSDEILANGWYKKGGADRSHLIVAGYEALAARIVKLIP